MANTVSYNLVIDINYIITAIISPDHKIRDMNSYISQIPKGKLITNVVWAVLYWFLRIGVVFFASFCTGWNAHPVYQRVGVCLQTDKAQCLYIHEVMRASKWKVEIQIHWIECISVDTLAYRNEWNMRYACLLVKHLWRFQSLTGTICSLVLNICFTFWKKWALNRLQKYLISDCMGYQCHIWRNTWIAKLFF